MNVFLKILGRTVFLYVVSWVAMYVLPIAPFVLIIRMHFLLPSVAAAAFLVIFMSPMGRNLPRRGTWVLFGICALLLNSFLSWEAWKLYRIQNDAPMGLIPDFNALFCLVADFLLMGVVFGVFALRERGQKGGTLSEE